MSLIAKTIGYAALAVWLAGMLGLVDVSVCVGEPGACSARPAQTIDTPGGMSV